jgi:hypothetical protein
MGQMQRNLAISRRNVASPARPALVRVSWTVCGVQSVSVGAALRTGSSSSISRTRASIASRVGAYNWVSNCRSTESMNRWILPSSGSSMRRCKQQHMT